MRTLKIALMSTLFVSGAVGCKTTGNQGAELKDGPTPAGVNGTWANWSCVAGDENNQNRKTIGVYERAGNQLVPDSSVPHLGQMISVVHMTGGQPVLDMKIGEEQMMVYDPSQSLYTMTAKGISLQCYYQPGIVATPLRSGDLECGADWQGNQEKRALDLQRVGGAQVVNDVSTTWKGYPLGAQISLGDQFENQQLLSVTVGQTKAKIYGPGDGLVTLTSGGEMRVQCYQRGF